MPIQTDCDGLTMIILVDKNSQNYEYFCYIIIKIYNYFDTYHKTSTILALGITEPSA